MPDSNSTPKTLSDASGTATELWARPIMVELDLNSARGNFCNYTDEGDFKMNSGVCS